MGDYLVQVMRRGLTMRMYNIDRHFDKRHLSLNKGIKKKRKKKKEGGRLKKKWDLGMLIPKFCQPNVKQQFLDTSNIDTHCKNIKRASYVLYHPLCCASFSTFNFYFNLDIVYFHDDGTDCLLLTYLLFSLYLKASQRKGLCYWTTTWKPDGTVPKCTYFENNPSIS